MNRAHAMIFVVCSSCASWNDLEANAHVSGSSTHDAGAAADAGGLQPDAGADGGVHADAGVGPASLSGLAFWFSADTNVAIDGGAVMSWTSHAGEILTLTPIAGAVAPHMRQLNGVPSIYLEGRSAQEQCPCPGFTTRVSPPLSQPFTSFVVFKANRYTDTSANYEAVLFTDALRHAALYTAVDPGIAIGWAINAGQRLKANNQTDVDYLRPHLLTAEFNGSTSTLRLDGLLRTVVTGPVGAGELEQTLLVGTDGTALNSFQGDLGELLFFKRVLTEAEREATERFLLDKWSL